MGLLALPDDGATSLRQPGRTSRPAVKTGAIRQIGAILARRAT
jgi:hypothetical protein